MIHRHIFRLFTLLICLCGLSVPAMAASLIDRVPVGGNLILAVDATAFMHSPLAVSQGWDGATPGQFPKSPNPFREIPGLKQMLMTANIETQTAQTTWQTSVLQMDHDVDLPAQAAQRAGYMDSIENHPVAVLRGDVFFVDLGGQTVGVTWPADRRFTAKWLRQTPSDKVSDYLRAAAALAGQDTPVVLAMDLSDVISEARIKRTLTLDPPAAGIDPAVIAPIMASLQGVTIRIALGDVANADQPSVQATMNFSKDPAAFAPFAKAIVMDILNDKGLAIPDVEKWNFAASGNTVTAQGPLSLPSLRKIMDLLHSPGPGANAIAAGPKPGNPAQPGQPAQAVQPAQPGQPGQIASPLQSQALPSKEYYTEVCRMLDDLSQGSSLGSSAGMLNSDARRIDQLPILNVDQDLVAWGADVSAAFRQSASIFSVGQQRMTATVDSVAAPDTTNYYNSGSMYANTNTAEAQANNALRNASQQRRQLAAQSKSQTLDAAFRPLQGILDSRPKIRALMVQRYQIEF